MINTNKTFNRIDKKIDRRIASEEIIRTVYSSPTKVITIFQINSNLRNKGIKIQEDEIMQNIQIWVDRGILLKLGDKYLRRFSL